MVKFFNDLRTDTFRKNLIGALIGVTVLFLLIIFGLNTYTRHNESVTVPDLRGMSIDEAVKKLQAADFEDDLDSVYQVDARPG